MRLLLIRFVIKQWMWYKWIIMLVIFGLTSISIILGTVIRLNDQRTRLFEMFCVTWNHLYNLKNDKKLKVTLFHGCFPHFFNWTNGTRSHNASSYLFIWTIVVLDLHKRESSVIRNVYRIKHLRWSFSTKIVND